MPTERPRYRTWIRRSRLIAFAVLTLVCLAGAALAVLAPWFLLFLLPLPFPLRHPRVLGHAMLLTGSKAG
jgi:hypothetical protein